MLTVVLDTTVLGSDWRLQGPATAFIVAECTAGRLRLIVPELVVKEAVNLYTRERKTSQKQLLRAARKHQRLSLGEPDQRIIELIAGIGNDDPGAAYEDHLRALLKDADAFIAALPAVPHDQLVTRALAGQRPFDTHGHGGYRDALIWHTVLEAATEHGRVIFISSNTSDFAAARQTPNTLPDALIDDIQALRTSGYPDARVDLRPTPSVFVRTDCPPEQQVLVQLRERLKSDRGFRERVTAQLDQAHVSSWPDWEVDGDIGVEWEENDLDMVGDLRDFRVDFASSTGDRILVQLSGHADIQVSYLIKGSAAWYDSPPEILNDIDWNGRSDTGTYLDVVPAALEFEALYRPDAGELHDVKLTKIREAWDWVEEGRVLGGPVGPPSR
jgi:predicted nucleic acid-binding protein